SAGACHRNFQITSGARVLLEETRRPDNGLARELLCDIARKSHLLGGALEIFGESEHIARSTSRHACRLVDFVFAVQPAKPPYRAEYLLDDLPVLLGNGVAIGKAHTHRTSRQSWKIGHNAHKAMKIGNGVPQSLKRDSGRNRNHQSVGKLFPRLCEGSLDVLGFHGQDANIEVPILQPVKIGKDVDRTLFG
ncbi:MAG: hypothetical protein AAAC47_22755, partial [Pararhizobium sp.]